MNIRRYHIEGIYFITTVTKNRMPLFGDSDAIELLFDVLRNVKRKHPFDSIAYCIMPDHIHLMLKVTDVSNHNISTIMHAVKRQFTLRYKQLQGLQSFSAWQTRFYDHIIRDQKDFEHHLNYIHFNPIKHGLAIKSEDYQYSSFRYYLKRGYYEIGWGHTEPEDIKDMWLE